MHAKSQTRCAVYRRSSRDGDTPVTAAASVTTR